MTERLCPALEVQLGLKASFCLAWAEAAMVVLVMILLLLKAAVEVVVEVVVHLQCLLVLPAKVQVEEVEDREVGQEYLVV